MTLFGNFYVINEFQSDESGLKAAVQINKEHSIFSGHFPNHPVTPGVCTLQIIKELSEKFVGHQLMLKSARNVKFMAIINPQENDTIQVQLQIDKSNQDLIDVKGTVLTLDSPALKFGGTFHRK